MLMSGCGTLKNIPIIVLRPLFSLIYNIYTQWWERFYFLHKNYKIVILRIFLKYTRNSSAPDLTLHLEEMH